MDFGFTDLLIWRPPIQRTTLTLGVLIVLLAALLRLTSFETTLIGGDQSAILSAAFNIAHLNELPRVSIKSSAGMMHTAVVSYIAALPLFFVPKVSAVQWFFSALDVLAVAWLYHALHRAVGRRAAVVGALLYAAHPWVVEYMRWIWQPTHSATFATVACGAFLLLLAPGAARRPRVLALGLFAATLMGLVHLAAAPWTVALFALGLGLAWRRGLWRGFAWGLGLSVLAAAPYLSYQVQTGFRDIFLAASSSGGEAATFSWAAPRLCWELVTGLQVLSTPRNPLWSERIFHLPGAYAIIPATLALALLAGLVHIARRSPRWPQWLFLIAWTVGVPALFLRSSVHLQHYYFLFLFPAPLALLALWLEDALAAPQRLYRATGVAGLLALLVLSAWWAGIWGVRIRLQHAEAIGAPTRGWRMDRTAAQLGAYLRDHEEVEVLVLNDFSGHLSPFDWLRNLLRTDRVRAIPTAEGLLIPPGASCYLLGPGASEAHLAPIAAQITFRPEMTISAPAPWRFACLDARTGLPAPLATWQNGLSLLHVEIEGEFVPGGTLQLTHTWRYRAVAPQDYHFFNHLTRGDDMVAQVDGVGVPTWYWRDDDVLLAYFTLQLPETLESGEYRLRLGNYTWPAVERMLLEDGRDAYEAARWTVE